MGADPGRRLVITVCPREPGTVALPLERGDRPTRMSAAAVRRALDALVVRRGLAGRVQVREGCAGGCGQAGPNVDVAIHRLPPDGEPADHVAIGWRTYVYSLRTLACLADVVDDNLGGAGGRGAAGGDAPVYL